MRKCSKCGEEKLESEFYARHAGCKPCYRAAANARYRANSQAWKDRERRRPLPDKQAVRNAHREKKKDVVNKIKETTPCADCGGFFKCWVMEFDHRDRSTKSNTISALLSCSWSLKRVLEEIAKCDLVCANCHRMRTAVQLGWVKHVDAAPVTSF